MGMCHTIDSMSDRKINFVQGEFYHVYNRGNSKQIIFKDNFDYQRFQILLYLCNATEKFKIEYLRKQKKDFYTVKRECLVAIGSYCLMPNHYHILLTPLVDDGVSQFMKKIGTAYSMYFNHRYERSGSLFEGKFKAQWADEDEYLKYLFSYIHLNPLKLVNPDWKESGPTSKDKIFLDEYQYSSFFDLLHGNKRREQLVLNKDPFPKYFGNELPTDHVYKWFSDRKDLLLKG